MKAIESQRAVEISRCRSRRDEEAVPTAGSDGLEVNPGRCAAHVFTPQTDCCKQADVVQAPACESPNAVIVKINSLAGRVLAVRCSPRYSCVMCHGAITTVHTHGKVLVVIDKLGE